MIKLKQKNIFILLLVFSIVSCSTNEETKRKQDKKYADFLTYRMKPTWFKEVKRFRLESRDGDNKIHFFYDVDPKVNLKTKILNTVVVTPKYSDYLNEVNLSSGQIHTLKKACGTYDSTKKLNSVITGPNFHVGFVPRYLDQLNEPQKIIIFGEDAFIKNNYLTHYFDVKVIGGYVERICPRGACLKNEDWNSRMVLIGVKRGDDKFEKVKKVEDLKALIDWNYFIAFLKNGFGKNKVASNYYQAYQLGNFISQGNALSYLKSNSNFFSNQKIAALKKSCYKLFDYAYDNLSFRGVKDINMSDIKTYKKKKRIEAKLKKEGKKSLKAFHYRFRDFYKDYRKNFKTCSRFVYSSNINHNPKRHWFFYYLKSAYILNDLGFTYRCSQKAWIENSIMSNNQLMYSREKEFLGCSTSEIEFALSSAPKFLESLSSRGYATYRYIDYDRVLHHKIYDWTSFPNKRFKCDKEELEFYPKDVSFSELTES